MRQEWTVFLLTLAAVSMPLAAENGAWFGTPVPPALSDPRQPIMKHDDTFCAAAGAVRASPRTP